MTIKQARIKATSIWGEYAYVYASKNLKRVGYTVPGLWNCIEGQGKTFEEAFAEAKRRIK